MDRPIYVNIDRGKHGRCGICLKRKELSWDHILPNKGVHYDELVLHSIHQVVNGELIKFRPRLSQDGLKLRTICRDCNSKLGSRYDHALIEFVDTIKLYGESNIYFQGEKSITCKPNAIIRSILGHLIAAKLEIDFSEYENSMRRHVFNENIPIPESLNVFYWAYPYKNLAVIRDTIMLKQKSQFGEVTGFQIYMFYPVAFLVTDLNQYENLKSLSSFNSLPPEKEAKIKINLNEQKDPYWPFKTDDDIIVLGQAAHNSILGTERINLPNF
jgi:hypothetical protein